jgi:hypothetical protein
LFSLRSLRLQFVEWVVEYLSVVGKELTKLHKVDLDDSVLRQ